MAKLKVDILDQKIKEVRAMTQKELESEGWDLYGSVETPAVLVLENGTKLYARPCFRKHGQYQSQINERRKRRILRTFPT